MSKKPETPVKRIPNGTRVRWQTEHGYGEIHDGVVNGFDANLLCYIVEVDRTRTGRPRPVGKTKIMRPWASRLEAQNANLLK